MSFPLHQADFYKLSHKKFEAAGTTTMYVNMTARSDKYMRFQDSERRVVFVGLQRFIKSFLIDTFNKEFFQKPKAEVIAKFKRSADTSLGIDSVPTAHIEALHDLGYLPILIKALPEGTKAPFKIPLLTIRNNHPDFAWLVTYLETVVSQEVWPTITAATTAYQFFTLCNRYADDTVGNRLHVPFQCHDFSSRGMMGMNAAVLTGLGHLSCFSGTDTIPAIDAVEDYYNTNAEEYFIAGSVPASEHSVTSLGIAVEGELPTLHRWLTETYPTGIVSIVSDTLDYWKVLTEYLPVLKPEILARQASAVAPGKVVIRPDSGDPVRIIAGYREDEIYRMVENGVNVIKVKGADVIVNGVLKSKYLTENEVKGSIEVLWGIFGGSVNSHGYRELDPHIGLIYGDSITLDRAEEIFMRLQQRNFASTPVVFGVGSYTYQMVSRDTLGLAIKATYAEVDGQGFDLYKDPATDDGTKTSARGLLRVEDIGYTLALFEQQEWMDEQEGLLQPVFENSVMLSEVDWDTIRHRVQDIEYPQTELTAGGDEEPASA